MEKAAIYARYSSHSQREESIEQQIDKCRKFAEQNGYQVVKVYSDKALSGKTDQRPQFQKMISDSEKSSWTILIVYGVDRFARNRYDSAIYKARLKKNGVKVVYATGSIPDTPEGIILESVMEGYAEYYSENLSRNIKRGLTDNATKGIYCGGRVPLGYSISEDKHFVIDPKTAELVRMIYHDYVNGDSITDICTKLNGMGFTSVTGVPFNKNSLHTLLTNERYTGVYIHGSIRVEGAMPQIIDRELFDRVQEVYKKNGKIKAHHRAKVEYLLTGKIFCGHCEAMMVGDSGTSKNGEVFRYYSCSTRKHDKKCDKKSVKAEWLEDQIITAVCEKMLNPEKIVELATKAHDLMASEAQNNALKVSLEEELKETETALKNVLKAIEQGIIFPTTLNRVQELEEKKAALTAELEVQEIKTPVLTVEQIAFWLEKFCKGDTKSPTYRRRIVDTLINKVYLFDLPGGGTRITILCNTTNGNTIEISCSDIVGYAPLNGQYPNTFTLGSCFGFIIEVSAV